MASHLGKTTSLLYRSVAYCYSITMFMFPVEDAHSDLRLLSLVRAHLLRVSIRNDARLSLVRILLHKEETG